VAGAPWPVAAGLRGGPVTREETGGSDDEPVPDPRRPASLPGWPWTVASALLLVPVLVVVLWPVPGTRVASLDDPERALARIVGRTMDVRDAVRAVGPVERRLHQAIGMDAPGDLDQGIAWYRELVREAISPSAGVYLAVLEAESGRLEPVRDRAEAWARREEPFPSLAALIGAAYLGPWPAAPSALFPTLAQRVEPGWFRDRLQMAIGRSLGDRQAVDEAQRRAAARAGAVFARARVLVAILLVVAVGGAIAVAVLARVARRPERLVIGTAPIPPPWPGRLGAIVLLHGGAATAAAGLVLVFLMPLGGSDTAWNGLVAPLLEVLLGVMIAIPVALLARRYLFRPRGLGLAEGLGLGIVPGRGGRLVIVVPALIVLMLAGDWVIGQAAEHAGEPGHWTEWFEESFVFGGLDAVATTLVGAVVLAPITEEIVFRGVLYPTLRRRLAWPLAAGASGLAFAALHGYGVAGFASVWWSGFVWAWSYERTRSLWPTIAAHAAGNLWASSLVLTLLR
jgi:uncharacterized protein